MYVLGICAILGAAYLFQFGLGEHPCPLCLLQRIFMLISVLGPAHIVYRFRKGTVTAQVLASGWGTAVVAALAGSVVSGSQVLMHIVPPDPGYAGALFGLRLYTWATITFFLVILASGAGLLLSYESKPPDAGREADQWGSRGEVDVHAEAGQ
ncbi:disulfide bond formation protein B [Streptomyces noursei]|uniref:disulfide bond formation protein B n=1 Tax=Streptomyces noursei TaxID=1971 RepID=UPI000C9C8D4B|nr:disulfide bond formation protein B [Streptomyces noursei]